METDVPIKKGAMPANRELMPETKKLLAKTYNSGFADAHDTYNALSPASDGKIYYILSSDKHDVAGRMFCYDPSTDEIKFLADLTEACGEKGKNMIAQGKSHVDFFECGEKLYFSTHVGFYELIDGMDRLPVNAPAGFGLYAGGHILSYDLKTGAFQKLATISNGEGVVAMTMDCDREQIFIITWPTGRFLHYDVKNNQIKDLGLVSGIGEAGTPGDDFRSLCRSLVVDAGTGIAYFSSSEGDIFSYKPGDSAFVKLKGIDLRIDYFGKYDPKQPGSMGYNWRKIFWHKEDDVAYGVHGNSGYLFKFDPKAKSIELIERITSGPSRKCGMFDQFSYGYLGFTLGPDNKTVYYLTGGPIYVDGERIKGQDKIAKGAARGVENLHLVTYNLKTNEYSDHGSVFYENGERPLYVNSIAVGNDESIYTLARTSNGKKVVTDLVKIPNPFLNKQNDIS